MIDAGWQVGHESDRRQALRRRTRRKAMVVVNSGWSTFHAQVLNLSVDGALIELEGPVALPEIFQLRYDGIKKQATRVWTRGVLTGVAFE